MGFFGCGFVGLWVWGLLCGFFGDDGVIFFLVNPSVLMVLWAVKGCEQEQNGGSVFSQEHNYNKSKDLQRNGMAVVEMIWVGLWCLTYWFGGLIILGLFLVVSLWSCCYGGIF